MRPRILRADATTNPKAVASKAGKNALTPFFSRDPETRHVQPLHLLCWQYAWYLFAWDYERQDIRTFALGRMTSVKDTGQEFKAAVRFDLREELKYSFGITRAKKPERVHLRFVPTVIPLIVERLWHPSQQLTLNEKDGTLDLTMEVAICPELIRWVAGWRQDVQILSPTALNDTVVQGAADFLKQTARRLGVTVASLLK
jgi:predicted DNA-binding transcriptional regulator YafY